MTVDFEELDYQQTPLGEISLRRRAEPRLDGLTIYEVKLGEEFLMSSLFTEAEIQLSKLALELLPASNLDVVVGGLGLGYTAAAALESSAVKTVRVIDVMQPVIDWHQRHLVPLGETISNDPRCTLAQGDFFKLATEQCFDPADPGRKYHAVLLDIDHSPSRWLNAGNGEFYTEAGLAQMADQLRPGGVFGLWSDDPPNEAFIGLVRRVFSSCTAHEIAFDNPYTGDHSTNSVYLASK